MPQIPEITGLGVKICLQDILVGRGGFHKVRGRLSQTLRSPEVEYDAAIKNYKVLSSSPQNPHKSWHGNLSTGEAKARGFWVLSDQPE